MVPLAKARIASKIATFILPTTHDLLKRVQREKKKILSVPRAFPVNPFDVGALICCWELRETDKCLFRSR